MAYPIQHSQHDKIDTLLIYKTKTLMVKSFATFGKLFYNYGRPLGPSVTDSSYCKCGHAKFSD